MVTWSQDGHASYHVEAKYRNDILILARDCQSVNDTRVHYYVVIRVHCYVTIRVQLYGYQSALLCGHQSALLCGHQSALLCGH